MQPSSVPKPGYDPVYFSPLFEIEDRHFWFRARNKMIGSLVEVETSQCPEGYRVLEIGCGTGNVLQLLENVCRNGRVIGMDLFNEGLNFARRRVSCSLVQGDLHASPFAAQFQVVGMFDVLEHLSDDCEVLQNVYDMLVPGGVLFLTVPAYPSLWSYFDEASHHTRRYILADLNQKLQKTGFKVEQISYYMVSILPLVWAERKLQGKNPPKNVDSEQAAHDLTVKELKIIPGINEILGWLLERETWWLMKKIRLPAGTSLMALARKPEQINP
jgi:ubiquinone/menaquinone biosynthesis C-methylase UbiE